MKKTILDQEEISPSQKGALARAKKYAEMETKYCTSCERDYPIEKMQKGKTKCTECYKDLERIRNRKRNR